MNRSSYLEKLLHEALGYNIFVQSNYKTRIHLIKAALPDGKSNFEINAWDLLLNYDKCVETIREVSKTWENIFDYLNKDNLYTKSDRIICINFGAENSVRISTIGYVDRNCPHMCDVWKEKLNISSQN